MISGYLGNADTFDRAIGEFAIAYADQNELDYRQLVDALSSGRLEAIVGL
jgi:Uncharacterized protein conserved in bacteria (DUF2252)